MTDTPYITRDEFEAAEERRAHEFREIKNDLKSIAQKLGGIETIQASSGKLSPAQLVMIIGSVVTCSLAVMGFLGAIGMLVVNRIEDKVNGASDRVSRLDDRVNNYTLSATELIDSKTTAISSLANDNRRKIEGIEHKLVEVETQFKGTANVMNLQVEAIYRMLNLTRKESDKEPFDMPDFWPVLSQNGKASSD